MYQQRRSGLGRQDRGLRGSGGSYRDAGRGGMSRGGGGGFGRFGGGGGGGGGGFGRSSDDFGRSGRVNPWQSGMMPGMNDSSSRGGGLLPTPGGQSSNLLNQLSSPEAQLALAGNLLSTILKPQQQQQQENQQVQQLLNLSALGQLGNRAAAGLASLAQAQMQVQSQSGRSSSWGSMGPATKRRRFDGLSGRRIDLGNKPTLGRDSFGSRDRRLQRGSFDQRPGTKGSRPPARRTVGSRSERRDDRRNEKEERTKRDDKKENEDDKERDEENEEESGEEKEKDENSGKEDSQSASRYAGLPATLLFCQVCEKKMWDDSSFENHIRGRNHHMMLDRLEESFTIRAQLMRQQVKLAEQKREILLDKLQRQGKKINMKNREYCTMCDLNFVGNILSHRKTATHQKLKTFLHPKCVLCSKEFTTRLDWEKHKLTAFHLKRVVEADETPDEKSEQDDLDDFDAMDLVTLDSVGNVDDDESQLEDMENAEDEAKAKEKPKGEGEEEEKKSETGAAVEKKPTETLTTAERWSQLAASKYDPAKTYGVSMVRKVSGYFCRLCHKFFVQEQEALQTHCKTRSHFEKYVLFIKAKVKAAEQQKAKEEKEKKIKKSKLKAKHGSDEEEEDDDDDGNWKRRKVNKGDVEEDEEGKEQLGGDEDQAKAADGQAGEEDDSQKKTEDTKDVPDKMDVDVDVETQKEAEEQKSHDKEEDQDSSVTEDQDAKKLGTGGREAWEGEESISEAQDENEGVVESETGDQLEAEQLEINGDEKAVASDPLEEETPCEDEEGDLDTLLEKVSGEIGMVKDVSETGKTKATTAKRVSTGRGRGRKRK